MLYSSGLRVSEVCELRINNIQFDLDLIRFFGKGSKERIIPLLDCTLELLKLYLSKKNQLNLNEEKGLLILSKKGQAREVSLPPDGDSFKSDLVTSSRIKQGILNNPLHDKRTTKGTFHIVEGNLPVPLDKKEVPKVVFAHFLNAAFNPSEDLKTLPFTSR
mgnify:CR=1 FL=1